MTAPGSGPARVRRPGTGQWGRSDHVELFGVDSVLRYASGGAHRTLAAVDALMAGSCAGRYQVIGRALGGDESLLLHSTDLSVVQPQAAHGREIYYAVVRKGDYLLWIALINPSQASGQVARATTLAHRALQRLCAAVTC